jgi:5-methylcytosine-specific restriction protein A
MSSWRNMADRVMGKAPPNAKRSSKWRTTRNTFLRGKACACCGGKIKLTAHHKIPFYLAPDLELEYDNLIALCQAEKYGINCHQLLGHLGNWKRINVYVEADVAYWRSKLRG